MQDLFNELALQRYDFINSSRRLIKDWDKFERTYDSTYIKDWDMTVVCVTFWQKTNYNEDHMIAKTVAWFYGEAPEDIEEATNNVLFSNIFVDDFEQ